MYKIFGLFTCLLILTLPSKMQGQDFNVGIRAGLAQSKFIGTLEEGITEDFGLSGGFHFGINFQWNFNEFLGWRTELLYTQLGSSYEMNAENGAYIFNDFDRDIQNLVFRDESRVTFRHSNAYVNIPQTIHLSVGDKFEVFGGAYLGFLISPVATGQFEFAPNGDDLTEHRFTQGLNFNYHSDPNVFLSSTCPAISANGDCILIRVQGQDVDIPRVMDSDGFWNAGGTIFDEEVPGKFKSIDGGLIVGASYYLNRGLYLMGRVEYGLRDITRNEADYSFANVNDDATLIYRDDFDRNVSFQFSLGFRF